MTIGAETYFFKNYDRGIPASPRGARAPRARPIRCLDYDQPVAAYLKFFTRPTQKRLDRTAWLIGQQMHTWLPGLSAAPLVWVEPAMPAVRGSYVGFCRLSGAGRSRRDLAGTEKFHPRQFAALPRGLRRRCVRDLLLALSVLEQEGIVHGDLSPNNIVIDLEARPDQPALYLIDFDAFVAPAAGGNAAVTVAEGGTYGTEGYCPPDLGPRRPGAMVPRRPIRTAMRATCCCWNCSSWTAACRRTILPRVGATKRFERRYAAWLARGDPRLLQTLSHLDPATVFTLRKRSAGLGGACRRSGSVAAAGPTAAPHDAGLEFHARRAWSSRLCTANR